MQEAAETKDPFALCGIAGEPHEPVRKGELNDFFRRARIYHLRPIQKQVKEVHSALFDDDHGIVTTMKTLKTIRRWICLGATWAAALVLGGLTLLDKLHTMGIFK